MRGQDGRGKGRGGSGSLGASAVRPRRWTPAAATPACRHACHVAGSGRLTASPMAAATPSATAIRKAGGVGAKPARTAIPRAAAAASVSRATHSSFCRANTAQEHPTRVVICATAWVRGFLPHALGNQEVRQRRYRRLVMGLDDKVRNEAEELSGKAKEGV